VERKMLQPRRIGSLFSLVAAAGVCTKKAAAALKATPLDKESNLMRSTIQNKSQQRKEHRESKNAALNSI